jgi:hypothetical protein
MAEGDMTCGQRCNKTCVQRAVSITFGDTALCTFQTSDRKQG